MKPKIEKIEFTKEQKQEIDKTLKINLPTAVKKIQTQYYGGSCCICAELPDYKVTYDLEDAKRIERYCQKDFDLYKGKMDD